MLFLLLLLPVTPAYQFKQFNFKITAVDERGKPLPSCELEISASGFLGVEKYVTDKNGAASFSWQAMKSVAVVSRRRDYATQYYTFDNLDKAKAGDTLKTTLVMKSTAAAAKAAESKTTAPKTTNTKTKTSGTKTGLKNINRSTK